MKATTIFVIAIIALLILGGAYTYTSVMVPAQKFKVAAIYVTPLEETWNQILHKALQRASNELNIEYRYSERVSEADVERVIREYIAQGYRLIIPHSWGFWETTDRLAPQFPNVYFAQGSGLCKNFGRNLVLYDYYIQEAAYVAGAIAAKVSKTNKLGIVTAFPGIGDVNNLLNGFIEGAKSVNPDVKVLISYINSWYNPSDAKIAASALISAGVDVIYAERYGVFEACKDPTGRILAYAFGNIEDQNSLAPDVVIGSVVWDLYPMVKTLIEGARAGNYPAGVYYTTMKTGGAKFVWNP
ncbi:MAG: BMP family protein, partial [Candidatus Methanomethyliaceae archaeon]|nr:BMP family protein [Candidatus Methanomethyliaceae archaeon]MDW7971098.1 BMP family protein [Nitrososphaerota archaeon]